MEYAVGIILAVGVSGFARLSGFDRDRAFYPTVVLVVAHYYVLFAVIGGSMRALALELVVMTGFVAAAVVGLRRTWVVVAALAGHGVFDVFHGYVIANAGVPAWWPGFCLTYDIVAAPLVAWLSLKAPPSDAAAHRRA